MRMNEKEYKSIKSLLLNRFDVCIRYNPDDSEGYIVKDRVAGTTFEASSEEVKEYYQELLDVMPIESPKYSAMGENVKTQKPNRINMSSTNKAILRHKINGEVKLRFNR